MPISYASNPTTETMYAVATKGQTVVVQPGSPTPGPQPTRRAAIQAEKATRLYATGDKEKQALVLKAIKAVEDILSTAN